MWKSLFLPVLLAYKNIFTMAGHEKTAKPCGRISLFEPGESVENTRLYATHKPQVPDFFVSTLTRLPPRAKQTKLFESSLNLKGTKTTENSNTRVVHVRFDFTVRRRTDDEFSGSCSYRQQRELFRNWKSERPRNSCWLQFAQRNSNLRENYYFHS